MPKVTELANGRGGVQTQALWIHYDILPPLSKSLSIVADQVVGDQENRELEFL